MRLGELLQGISYRLPTEVSADPLERLVTAIATRVEDAGEGALFVCVRTALSDGHDLAVAAYGAGCRLFLARRALPLPGDAVVLEVEEPETLLGEISAAFFGHPARELTVLGITGSVGKTTVLQMTASLLKCEGHSVAMLTTDGEQIGDAFVPAGSVVPDALRIHAFLRRAADAGAELALLELSPYMLVQGSAFSIPFTALLLTDPKEDSAFYGAWRELLAASDAPFCVLPTAHAALAAPTRGRRLLCGEGGQLFAEHAEPYVDERGFGMRFTLCTDGGERFPVSVPVVGDLAVENALLAAMLARIVGLSSARIAAALCRFVPNGRLECVAARAGRYVFVDNAYTAERLSGALDALRPYTRGRLSVLLGSVGGRARSRRAALGRAAARGADMIYLTADDPADEDPLQICREIEQGVGEVESVARCVIVPDRAKAICRAVLEMRSGDVLLLAGKGGQQTQLVRGERLPFSERELVREAFLRK